MSIAHAFHPAERSRTAPPGRASMGAPQIMGRPELAGTKTTAPVVRRCSCGGSCPRCQTAPSHSSASATRASHDAPSSVHAALQTQGQPLGAGTREFFESRFGADFSDVRVHADAPAHESARDINAKAFTVGHDIVFGTGHFSPGTRDGQRLIAHELTHVVQQSNGSATPGVQRQSAPSSPCPRSVSLSSGIRAVHVPACGTTPVVASQRPANAPVTWSLDDGSTQPTFSGVATTVDPGTSISNATTGAGTITVGTGQTPGFVAVVADGAPGCTAPASGSTGQVAQLNFASTPVGVGATSIAGSLTTGGTEYGARFQNLISSASGNSAHLLQVRVNERFPLLPTPDASTHTFATPFGSFTLHTNPWTPSSSTPGWDIDASGIQGPDNLAIDRSLIDVGRFVISASNPTPATTLTSATPVGFTVRQDLHWLCPQAAVGSQWVTTAFASLTHTRHLMESSGDVTFVTGIPAPSLMAHSDPYTGQPAIINAAASPNPVTVSATLPPGSPRGTPRPTPNTTTVTADTLPSSLLGLSGTHGLQFSIRGNRQGCSIDATTGEVTVGTTPGTITVRVSDVARGNRNFDEVPITIAAAAPAPTPSPVPPPVPTTTPPGLYPQPVPGEVAPLPPLPASP